MQTFFVLKKSNGTFWAVFFYQTSKHCAATRTIMHQLRFIVLIYTKRNYESCFAAVSQQISQFFCADVTRFIVSRGTATYKLEQSVRNKNYSHCA